MTRILFVAEAVALAHAVRLATLAGALDCSHYDLHFAVARRYAGPFYLLKAFARGSSSRLPRSNSRPRLPRDGRSMTQRRSSPTLSRDLRLIRGNKARPHYRRLPLVPCRERAPGRGSLCNDHQRPLESLLAAEQVSVPEHWSTRLLGVRVVRFSSGALQPAIFTLHARPLNRAQAPAMGCRRSATCGKRIRTRTTPTRIARSLFRRSACPRITDTSDP